MNYTGVKFYKDPLDELDTDLSDISDVKPSDIDKILKSAQDLDDEILSGTKDKTKSLDKDGNKKSTKNKNRNVIFSGDSLSDFGILSSDEDLALQPKESDILEKKVNKDALANIFSSNEEPKVDEIKTNTFNQKEQTSKIKSSSDWLGLVPSPEIKIKPPNSAPNFMAKLTTPSKPQIYQEQSKELTGSLNKSKTESDLFTHKSGSPVDQIKGNSTEMKLKDNKEPNVKRKNNLLDDLFGTNRIKKETPKIEKKVEFSGLTQSDNKPQMDKIESGYMPSLDSDRKIERKKDSTSNLSSTSTKINWASSDNFLGVNEKNDYKSDRNIFEHKLETTRNSGMARRQSKEYTLPQWLGGDSPVSNKQESQSIVDIQKPIKTQSIESTTTNFPDWLGRVGDPEIHHIEEIPASQTRSTPLVDNNTLDMPKRGVSFIQEPLENNVIGQLANVQAQLGAAMSRHNQNLQAYMQVLMNEAQRVGINGQMVVIQDNKINNVPNDDEEKKEMKLKIDEKEQYIKQQSEEIFEFQKQITKLELENIQLELKIKNIEEIKEMELDKLRKGFEFENSNWEIKLDRTKQFYEEIIAEYEEKISRLKQKAVDVEKEFQKRIETLETERLTDLEKLGEFHRLVLEQSAMISIPGANFSTIKVPLRMPIKPADEVELTERESNLIEKERNLEILKATVETEKRELDEALEREKIRREEREREVNRALMELKMKEEFNQKDYERKSEQLKQQEKQLKEMREEALKEQCEISKEKLALAAEKARLDATITIQSDPNSPKLNPLDIIRARAELEAALEAAREAREVADQERRRHVELRKTIEEIGWEQKDKDQQLDMRERHISYMIKDAENKKQEGLKALEEAQILNEELIKKQKDIKDAMKNLENKEKILTKEKLELAKERIELEKRKSQLELLLPELNPAEDFSMNPMLKQPSYVDPKAVIMRLKAEKDLQDYIAPLRKHQEHS